MEDEGDPEELMELLAGRQSRIIADNVYARWAPGSATIDYFMRGDTVDIHGSARGGRWRCVSGTSRYGQRHTAWVLAGAIRRSADDHDDGRGIAACPFGPNELDDFEVTFKNCRILGRGAFRYGPVSYADRIVGGRAPDGFLDPAQGRTCFARASNSQGGTRAPRGDYVWGAWRPDINPHSNHAPGKTGWFREDLLDCRPSISCSDDVGSNDQQPGGNGETPSVHRRWVVNPASFEAWGFDEVTHVTDDFLAHIPDETPLPFAPNLVRAVGQFEIWVMDSTSQGSVRRHIPDIDAFEVWGFQLQDVHVLPASVVLATPQGPQWPYNPVLVKGSGDAIYALDH